MKIQRVIFILTASLLVSSLAFGAYTSVFAQGGGYNPFDCNTGAPFPCEWEAEVCNPAAGEFETVGVWADPNTLPLDLFLVAYGVSEADCQLHGGMKETYKCKLTDVDSEIYLGTPFEASWIGHASYLRFMKPSGEFNYIAKVDVLSGSVHQDGNEYIGQFSARGKVEPGVYTVQCFGTGGTAGLGIKNVEIVGH